MTGVEIAQRAQQLLGAPFRLHGRDGIHGVDCVGLVAYAADLPDAPRDYAMRGDHEKRVIAALNLARLRAVSDGLIADGDILLLRCSPQQIHLAVASHGGAIHAHAGLRCVVWTPSPLPWPLIGHWRFSGD